MIPPATAIVIPSFPASIPITAADFNAGTYSDGVANEVWFQYIAIADQVFGFYTTDPFSSAFQLPLITIFAVDGTTNLAQWSGKAGGYGITNGTTYYVRIRRNSGGGAADQDFTVTVDGLDYLTSVPDGSVIINDDADGFPAIVFDISGNFLGYVTNIPAGEMGDALSSGISIWHDRFALTNKIKVIARDLTTIAQFDITGLGSGFPRFGHSDTDFYVAVPSNPSVIHKVTPAGVESTVLTLSGLHDITYVIAVNSDATILYYIESQTDTIIRRWDLVNNLALTDLYTIAGLAGVPSYRVAQTPNGHPGDILRLSNGNLVTWYRNLTAGQDTIIIVSDSGTLVNSFNLTSADYEVDHLSYNSGNPNSINVWAHDASTGYSTGIIGSYNLTTGTFTSSFTTNLYSELISSGDGSQLFGPSNSCTMVTLVSGDTPPPTPAILHVVKITVPSPDTEATVFPFTTTGGLSPSTFNLQDGGTRDYTGLADGTYGVSETVPAGWSVSYNVDNGDPHTAIELVAGDEVTVTITNTSPGPGPIIPGNPNSGIYRIVSEKRDDTLWESFSPKRIKLTKIP